MEIFPWIKIISQENLFKAIHLVAFLYLSIVTVVAAEAVSVAVTW